MPEPPAEKPVPLAMLIADHIYQDRSSGKWVVAGVLSALVARELPMTQQVLEIFFQLTNIHSTSTVRLVIEHADGDLKVLGVEGRANAPSPLDVVSQKISLRNVPFQKPGKYWVQLLHEGEILIQAPLYLHLWQQGQQPPPPPGQAS
jgi:hypothetical protein